jgi:hypothetical protein
VAEVAEERYVAVAVVPDARRSAPAVMEEVPAGQPVEAYTAVPAAPEDDTLASAALAVPVGLGAPDAALAAVVCTAAAAGQVVPDAASAAAVACTVAAAGQVGPDAASAAAVVYTAAQAVSAWSVPVVAAGWEGLAAVSAAVCKPDGSPAAGSARAAVRSAAEPAGSRSEFQAGGNCPLAAPAGWWDWPHFRAVHLDGHHSEPWDVSKLPEPVLAVPQPVPAWAGLPASRAPGWLPEPRGWPRAE